MAETKEQSNLKAGQFAYLTVKAATKVGAFLDVGTDKDLLVPFKEQEERLEARKTVMVFRYTDRSGRPAATTKLYDHLKPVPKGMFRAGSIVSGVVYRYTKEYGAFTAILPKDETPEKGKSYEELYFGLIPPSEVYDDYHPGDPVRARVIRVRSDGKLDIAVRAGIAKQLEADAETILKRLAEYDGMLPFSESASPAMILRELKMSKSAFKRALGHLYKLRKIEIGENEVRLL
ncbi:MAG: RNA-binding protein [Lachnospiraceae bacterium]|nr:RNA-binding protein [Lachnospiraceae bacterium]